MIHLMMTITMIFEANSFVVLFLPSLFHLMQEISSILLELKRVEKQLQGKVKDTCTQN